MTEELDKNEKGYGPQDLGAEKITDPEVLRDLDSEYLLNKEMED